MTFHHGSAMRPRRSRAVPFSSFSNGRFKVKTVSRVLGLLANPSYAGTYVFGRYQSSKRIGQDGEIQTQTRRAPE
ncbi:MAG: hypothetical protein HC871_13995, partial [Rhizobiales bacterium]|nr:hypothetical protein [Hyphomicrobiales bacterium]